eukprot:2924376-Prymnesium_polylepis.1
MLNLLQRSTNGCKLVAKNARFSRSKKMYRTGPCLRLPLFTSGDASSAPRGNVGRPLPEGGGGGGGGALATGILPMPPLP